MDIQYRFCTFEEFERVFRDDHPGEELWTDFVTARNASHIYGAEINGRIRGAIAFDRVAHEPIDDSEDEFTLSYLDFVYVSREVRGNGIATRLLAAAIQFLIDEDRTPIGCGFTSRKLKDCFQRLPSELKQAVVSLPTILDDGQGVWDENGL
jgi:GNAT superfamily N-acetyltransferase